MTFGEDQVIIGEIARLVPVIAKMPSNENGEQVCGRHARSRVT